MQVAKWLNSVAECPCAAFRSTYTYSGMHFLLFGPVLSATDIDGDGRAEFLVTTSIYQKSRVMIDASLLALSNGKPTVLGTWRAIKHCETGVDQKTTRKIYARMRRTRPAFRDEVETSRCYHQPARP